MKTIMVYGDSNTWGQTNWPFKVRPRIAYDERWTSRLEQAMSGRVRVIAEGLPGRTAGDVHSGENQFCNGQQHFAAALKSHEPVDVVVIALGTNDAKKEYKRLVEHILQDLRWYTAAVQQLHLPDYAVPAVLYIAPPALLVDPEDESLGGRQPVLDQLAAAMAAEPSMDVLLPQRIDTAEDGVHFSLEGHAHMAKQVVNTIEEMGL
jgi:lysophospholipase L1-like esterase